MGRKHLYITVEEKEEFKALIKEYGLEEQTARFRRETKPEPQIETRKRGRRYTTR